MIGLRFFPLKSADVRRAGTRDEPKRTSEWEVTPKVDQSIRLVNTLTVGAVYNYTLQDKAQTTR